MLPLGDFSPRRRFPFVTVGLVAANLAVWLFYQVPAGIDDSVDTVGFRPCGVNGTCSDSGLPWPVESLASMFAHGSWSHLVGNMVFLVAFGLLVENLLGPARYLLLYLLAGFAADALQGGITLAFAPGDADVPSIGASGAISGVIGAYLVARPFERVLTWLMPALFLRIPALGLLGVWFILQALEGVYALSEPGAMVGIAFFAHVGGFLAGVIVATLALPDAWTRSVVPHWRHPPGTPSLRA
jgi:membrane associated rhomboid family serine protease